MNTVFQQPSSSSGPERDATSDAGTILKRLDRGESVTWKEFLQACGDTILRASAAYGRDHDERMEVFLSVCEALRKDDLRRIRAFRSRPGAACRFTTFLTVVVRNLALDYHRARSGRLRPFASIRERDHIDQSIFLLRFKRRRSAEEISQELRQTYGSALSLEQVEDRIAAVEASLTPSQRWRLLSRSAPSDCLPIDATEDQTSAEHASGGMCARSEDPERPLRELEAAQFLTNQLAALSSRQRLILALRFRDGLDQQATAAALGLTIGQVDRASRDALEQLRGALRAHNFDRTDLEPVLAAHWPDSPSEEER